MTVIYRSQDSSSSNVIFSATYWSTFENQAPSSGRQLRLAPTDDDYDYDYDEAAANGEYDDLYDDD